MEEVFKNQVETICIDNVTAGDKAQEAIKRAVDEGCGIIFTTTPEFIPPA